MKRISVSLLLLGLLITCFAGCADEAVTPTDGSTAVQSMVASTTEVIAKEESTIKNEEASSIVPSKKEEKKPTASKISSQSTSSVAQTGRAKPQASSPTKTESRNDSIAQVPPITDPSFETEADYRNWLLTGFNKQDEYDDHKDIREAIHANMVNTLTTGNTIRYYRPDLSSTKYELDYLSVSNDVTTYYYRYFYVDETSTYTGTTLDVAVYYNYKEDMQQTYDEYKQWYETNNQDIQIHCKTVDSINYYYRIFNDGSVVIRWKQNGLIHRAAWDKGEISIDQLLPLLQLKPVTLRTDTVTE